MKSTNYHWLALFTLLIITLSACTNSKKAIYFSNSNKNEFNILHNDLEPVIQKNDLLNITVSSLNPEASKIFNVYNTAELRSFEASNAVAPVTGYLVDQDGFIQLPILGKVKAAGLTKNDLKNEIERTLLSRRLLLEPIVDIRYINYKVSVLGEVANPSVLTVPSEKISLLEALGLAGDLTIYANRENILLIREEMGKKKLIRLDLTSDNIFTSPYYYLKSNDIIYVEPNKAKITASGAAREWLPVVISSLTLVVVGIDRLLR